MLSQVEFFAEMQKLSSFFAKTQNADQLLIWFDRCKNLHLSAFKDAVNFCIENEKFFPTPKILLEKADIAQRQYRTRAISEENRFARRIVSGNADGKIGNYGIEYNLEAKALFGKVMRREIKDFELSEAMYAMAEKYPGNGWDKNAADVLEKWEIENGQKPIKKENVNRPNTARNVLCSWQDRQWGPCNQQGTISHSTTGPGENHEWQAYCAEHFMIS